MTEQQSFVLHGINLPLSHTFRWLLDAIEAAGPASGAELGAWIVERRGAELPTAARQRCWGKIVGSRLVRLTDNGYILTNKGRKVLEADRWTKEEEQREPV